MRILVDESFDENVFDVELSDTSKKENHGRGSGAKTR